MNHVAQLTLQPYSPNYVFDALQATENRSSTGED